MIRLWTKCFCNSVRISSFWTLNRNRAFCTSQSSVATVYRWGGHIYIFLVSSFTPKLLKSVDFLQSCSRKGMLTYVLVGVEPWSHAVKMHLFRQWVLISVMIMWIWILWCCNVSYWLTYDDVRELVTVNWVCLLFTDVDDTYFFHILSNKNQFLQTFLSERQALADIQIHSKALIDKTTDLKVRSFLIRVLYKDCCWLL